MQIQQGHTLSRAIRLYGKPVIIQRPTLNQFKEPAGETEPVLSCGGIYHAAGGHLNITVGDGGGVTDSKLPSLLILYTEKELLEKDMVLYGGKAFTVTGIDDPGELHLVLDISLKEV